MQHKAEHNSASSSMSYRLEAVVLLKKTKNPNKPVFRIIFPVFEGHLICFSQIKKRLPSLKTRAISENFTAKYPELFPEHNLTIPILVRKALDKNKHKYIRGKARYFDRNKELPECSADAPNWEKQTFNLLNKLKQGTLVHYDPLFSKKKRKPSAAIDTNKKRSCVVSQSPEVGHFSSPLSSSSTASDELPPAVALPAIRDTSLRSTSKVRFFSRLSSPFLGTPELGPTMPELPVSLMPTGETVCREAFGREEVGKHTFTELMNTKLIGFGPRVHKVRIKPLEEESKSNADKHPSLSMGFE